MLKHFKNNKKMYFKVTDDRLLKITTKYAKKSAV